MQRPCITMDVFTDRAWGGACRRIENARRAGVDMGHPGLLLIRVCTAAALSFPRMSVGAACR
jgi:hypothetical protein